MQTALNPDLKVDAQNEAAMAGSVSARKSRLKVVHIVSSLKVGGMEQFVLRIAADQQRAGHKVLLIALQDGPLHEKAREQGLHVRVLGGSNKIRRVVLGSLQFARFRPDIIHAHNQTSLHYACLGKRVSNARVVMTNHGQGMGSARTPNESEWSLTDAVVAVSAAVAQRMDNDRLSRKLTTIYNGVNLPTNFESRQQVRARLGLPGERILGTIVARIDNLKGHDTLLRALARLASADMPLTMLIAGDGAERANREDLARELGLQAENVRFLGFRNDVSDLLAASDFFVLPSLTEGLPLSVLEAMSHRLPVIATPVGGVPELIADRQTGLLVPVNEPVVLAEAMAELVRSQELRVRLGNAGYEQVRNEFSFDAMSQKYEALYYDLCSRPGSAAM